jgi:hypothetical protein
MWED